MSNAKKEKPANGPAALDRPEASSAPRVKEKGEEVALSIASFKMRAQGLDGEDLESEIQRFLDKMIERHVRIVPDRMKAEARELLRDQLETDPTMQAMIEDLRRGARRNAAG